MKLIISMIIAFVYVLISVTSWSYADAHGIENANVLLERAIIVLFAVFIPIMLYLSIELERRISDKFTQDQRMRFGVD